MEVQKALEDRWWVAASWERKGREAEEVRWVQMWVVVEVGQQGQVLPEVRETVGVRRWVEV